MSFVLFFSTLFCSTSLITRDLKELLRVMEVAHDGSPKSIVEETQKAWVRPAGKERWEVKDSLTPIQRKAVIDYCTKAGFFDEIRPLYLDYDYAVVLGAAISRMEKRIGYLEKMSNSGVRFKKVILLSGARPLDPSAESIPKGCKTEGDAMAYLWKANELSKKVAWEHFICPMKTTAEGKVRRPGTRDTFSLWLSRAPAPGRCFIVSNQPYCLFHRLVAKNMMPKEFTSEIICSAAEANSQNAQVMLDTIARCLYESINP